MIVDTVLTNAKAYLKGQITDCCISVEGGQIQKIGKEANMPKADEKIDLQRLLVLPGIIDSHVHLRDEEKAYKETFYTGTAAAAAGGVTTVLDMPNNSPITMSAKALKNRMKIAKQKTVVNVGFYSEFPTNLNEIEAIAKAGAIGFKLYMADQVGGQNIDNDKTLEDAFNKASEFPVPISFHAEDHELIKKTSEKLKLEHRDDIAAFLKAHDEKAEANAVKRVINLATLAKSAHIHFCHLSTEKALDMIAEAKKSNSLITCEVTPHHLLLTKNDYEYLGAKALTLPPLRTEENVEALWKALSNGTIDTIGSDHAPHTLEEKEASSIWDVKVGIPGIETMLPIFLTMVHKNRLSFDRIVQLLSEKPAEIFHLSDRGQIQPGKKADFAVIDFNCKYKIDAGKFKSKAKYSPFDKWDVQGKTVKTIVNGILVMDDGEIIVKPGSGQIVGRSQE